MGEAKIIWGGAKVGDEATRTAERGVEAPQPCIPRHARHSPGAGDRTVSKTDNAIAAV